MKLYTEEQVREAIDLAREVLIDNNKYPKYIILSEIKGIELPSDEEIQNLIGFGCKTPNTAINGAKWMRDKILNK